MIFCSGHVNDLNLLSNKERVCLSEDDDTYFQDFSPTAEGENNRGSRVRWLLLMFMVCKGMSPNLAVD